MTKVSMYPISITQPNQNTSNRTEGKYSKEIKRNGKIGIASLNHRDLNDPKYYHLWKNVSNLKSGGEARCGERSSYHCSHKTYYGIKGYRNTCPIAGATGTYTQPAALYLDFNPSKKGISSTATIKSVKITFKHRCEGVDVATDKTYTSWGPNFSGFTHYPNRKVLKVTFAGQTQEWNTNPPLSSSKYDTVSLTFKSTSKHKITYNHLNKGKMIIQYGNNLNTNPGNVYIKGLIIEVEYEEGKVYIEGHQSDEILYISDESVCRSSATFYVEAGYKNKGAKIDPTKAPKKFGNNQLTVTTPNSNIKVVSGPTPVGDNKTISFSIVDETNIEGVKKIDCSLKDVGEISFDYTAIKRPKPTITIPSAVEKNTAPHGVVSIKVTGGCTSKITVYDNKYDSNEYLHQFTSFTQNGSNMIPQSDVDTFYEILSNLPCGYHTLYFKRGNEPIEEMLSAGINILPTDYTLKFYEIARDNSENIIYQKELSGKLEVEQNKSKNTELLIEFVKTKDLLKNPTFSLINPTYGLNGRINPTSVDFTLNKEGGSEIITAGTYFPGEYIISIEEPENCSNKRTNLVFNVIPNHKQHFDEVFIRGEDSTAFDYDYMAVLKGDTIREPLYIKSITLGASYKDIKVCTQKLINTTINNPYTIPVKITNTSNRDIDNLFLELNTLAENEDGNFEVSTDEWVDKDGLFYNFSQKFKEYNRDISNVVDIKNLSIDDDEIDEEDVYIHIRKIYKNQTISVNIPIFSYIEKRIRLQILLFGETLSLYNINDCSDDTIIFDEIEINVIDAILTDMKITGDIDVLLPEVECPLECFNIQGVKYSIKNIDTSKAEITETIIENDPRLIPYKVLDKNGEEINLAESMNKIYHKSGLRTKDIKMVGLKMTNKVNFGNGYQTTTLKGYTDSKGCVTFYITIPESIGKEYTINDIKEVCQISSDLSGISYKIIDDLLVYSPGQVVPLKVEVIYRESYYINQLIFTPNIYESGAEDEVTIYYKVCNLKNNEGILKTVFKTDPANYKLLENKNRFNKDIEIHINELENVIKYSYYNHSVETGNIEFNNNEIIWKIDYLEKDTITTGYIDFRGDILGLSTLEISKVDFTEDITFNVVNCKCSEEEESEGE